MTGNIDIYKEFYGIYEKYINGAIKTVTFSSNKLIYIDFKRILTYEAPISILYEIISPYGFNSAQIRNMIINGAKMQTGSQFHSPDYRIVKHGQQLILGPKATEESSIEINIEDIGINPIGGLVFNYLDYSETINFSNKNHAYIDIDKLTFPLLIRHACHGDCFIPYGMKGRKMISDYFTDLKLNLFEKETTKLLISDGKIVWVIGYRIDERFKIEPSSTKILQVIKN
jgi:tRNA(Ile)-lysidine synthase